MNHTTALTFHRKIFSFNIQLKLSWVETELVNDYLVRKLIGFPQPLIGRSQSNLTKGETDYRLLVTKTDQSRIKSYNSNYKITLNISILISWKIQSSRCDTKLFFGNRKKGLLCKVAKVSVVIQ